jgi:hypothetical protein
MKYSILAALLAVSLCAPLPAVAQCPSGVIGYWPMDGDGTEQVNSIPGSVVGVASFVPGVVGQAVDLDGDGAYVDSGVSPELSDFGGHQMSLAAWVYREAAPPSPVLADGYGAVITARTFCNEGNWQLYGYLGNNVYYSKWLDGDEDQVFSGAALPLGTWTHVAVTYSSNEVRFYVNGAFFDSVTPLVFGGAINDEAQNVQVGWDSCSSYWSGRLDEVAIYNVTLTAAEVADLYQKGLDGVSLCVDDEDGDGVIDDADLCPFTTGTALIDGCDCEQILAFKPGENAGERPDNCGNGTLNVFSRRIGWAKDVPRPPS